MMSLQFEWEWRTTLLTACLLPVLVGLGFWQLQRADEKTAIASLNAQRAASPPAVLGDLTRADPQSLAYRRTIVRGHFLPEATIFLDNQIRDGRYGHDVLGVFVDDGSGLGVLLNRGWVAGDPARRSLPTVDLPTQNLSLEATVYVPPGRPYLLAEERFDELTWPVLVQEANGHALREAIERVTGLTLFPRELRLAANQPAGFRRDWPVVNVSSQKHTGYAVQWFTMAAALLLFAVFRSSNLLDVIRGNTPDSPSDSEES